MSKNRKCGTNRKCGKTGSVEETRSVERTESIEGTGSTKRTGSGEGQEMWKEQKGGKYLSQREDKRNDLPENPSQAASCHTLAR